VESKRAELVTTVNKMVIAWGGDKRESGEILFRYYNVSVRQKENILEIYCDNNKSGILES
jgi:hypothetical protein